MEKVIYPILIVLVSFVGGVIPIALGKGSKRFELFLNFSAGVIIGVAFFHMLPEAVTLIDFVAPYFTAFGIIALLLIERFITLHPCEIDECEEHGLGIPAFLGFSIHNFFDGVALGVSMVIPQLSFLTFLAILVHKAPMAFVLSTLLITDGYKRISTMMFNFAFALVIPIGTIFSYYYLTAHTKILLGYALAFSAGTFVYIALGDIVPNLHRPGMPKIMSSLMLVAGIIITFLVRNMFE